MAKPKKPAKKTTRKKRPALRVTLSKPADAVADFEKAISGAGKAKHYVLRLYITGTTARSSAAISNIRKFCDEHLAGRYELEVIDIYQQPTLAKGEQIIAAPALIKKLPFPLRKVVGDLSNEERVLMGLDIFPKRRT